MSKLMTLLVAGVVSLAVQNAHGDLITFSSVDPTTSGNTFRLDGGTPNYATANNLDQLWFYRTGQGTLGGNLIMTKDAGTTIEDAYTMVTTLSGLVSGATYNIYGYYDYKPNWDLKLGFSVGNMTDYGGDAGVSGREYGTILAGLDAEAHFSNLTGVISSTYITRELSLGTAVAGADGKIKVYVDDSSVGNPVISGSDARSQFVGVGYSLVPEPSTLALLGMGLMGLLAYAWRKRR